MYHSLQLFPNFCICPAWFAIGRIESSPNVILQRWCPFVGVFVLILGRPAVVPDMFVELIV